MILCWLNERFSSEGVGPLSTALRRHHKSCTACQRSAQATRSLEKLLAKDSKSVVVEPSPFLQARILQAIDPSTVAEKSGLSLQKFIFRLVLPVSFCALIAFVLVGNGRYSNSVPTHSPAKQLTRVQPVPLLPPFPSINIKVEDPLTLEMESLLADSKNAARSLAANFLPGKSEP